MCVCVCLCVCVCVCVCVYVCVSVCALGVTVGGVAWAGFNATAETVIFTAAELSQTGLVAKLQDVVVHY